MRKIRDPKDDQIGKYLIQSLTEGIIEQEPKQEVHKIVLCRILGRSRDLSLLLNLKEAEYEDRSKVELDTILDKEQ